MPSTAQVVTLGFVVLAIAFLFPTIIMAADSGTAEATITVGNGSGDITTVESAMRVQKLSQSGSTVTLSVTHLQSGNATEFSISEGENTTFVLDDDEITFEALVVDSNTGETTHRVEYPVTMGWTPESAALSDELPIIFAGLAVIIVVGFIARMQ